MCPVGAPVEPIAGAVPDVPVAVPDAGSGNGSSVEGDISTSPSMCRPSPFSFASLAVSKHFEWNSLAAESRPSSSKMARCNR